MSDAVSQEWFAHLAAALVGRKGVTLGSGRAGFGSDALQVHGRIFAMPRRGGLVLKLPEQRVAELCASGEGWAFDAGRGRPMKQWVVVEADMEGRWRSLTEEALAFVAGDR